MRDAVSRLAVVKGVLGQRQDQEVINAIMLAEGEWALQIQSSDVIYAAVRLLRHHDERQRRRHELVKKQAQAAHDKADEGGEDQMDKLDKFCEKIGSSFPSLVLCLVWSGDGYGA